MTKHKYFDDQLDDEEMLLLFRKHPIVMRKGLILASLGILVGPLYVAGVSLIRPASTPSINAYILILIAGFIFGGILFFPSWMSWYFSIYIVTDKRLIQVKQKGFFSRSMVDISNDQVSMVNYDITGLQETLLGFGTITVQTYVGELVIKDVHHPQKIQKEITSALREHGFLQASSSPFAQSNQTDTEE